MQRLCCFFSVFTVLALLPENLTPAVADDVRVGILGIDNFGSVAYTEFLNRPHAEGEFEGVRVVAAYPIGSPDYPDSDKLVAQWKQQLLNLYQNPKDPKDTVPASAACGTIRKLEKCLAVTCTVAGPSMHHRPISSRARCTALKRCMQSWGPESFR